MAAALPDALDIIHGSAFPMVVTDSNAVITIWNEPATDVFVWSAEEAVGQNISILIGDKHIKRKHDAWIRDYLLGKPSDVVGYPGVPRQQVRGVRKDGRALDLLLCVADVRLKDQSRCFVCTFCDQTKIRRESSCTSALCSTIFDARCCARVEGNQLSLVESSPQLDGLFGATMLGTDLMSFIDGKSEKERLLEHLRHMPEEGASKICIRITLAGQTFGVDFHTSPHPDDSSVISLGLVVSGSLVMEEQIPPPSPKLSPMRLTLPRKDWSGDSVHQGHSLSRVDSLEYSEISSFPGSYARQASPSYAPNGCTHYAQLVEEATTAEEQLKRIFQVTPARPPVVADAASQTESVVEEEATPHSTPQSTPSRRPPLLPGSSGRLLARKPARTLGRSGGGGLLSLLWQVFDAFDDCISGRRTVVETWSIVGGLWASMLRQPRPNWLFFIVVLFCARYLPQRLLAFIRRPFLPKFAGKAASGRPPVCE
eukprot:TRINITY_DN24668_c0_g1_i1.p1 TRINITY_DN24668_c0_g1~~TRINITY_DN24668_c0_g1_i1.p1  ORF type:complete len:483 (+),score=105.16 TRINITY_DN24668_c0_g1_i1:255-1703(+)